MTACTNQNVWISFIEFMKKRCSVAEFKNWIEPIKLVECKEDKIYLQVPNIFVQEYLMDNYKEDMLSFFPKTPAGNLALNFTVKEPNKNKNSFSLKKIYKGKKNSSNLNQQYTFENFVEGPSNQFVKSAAYGVATRPGKSFNPLFIHGGVGLGKTHLLHSIGHYISKTKKIKYITTESFINDLILHLRSKSIDKMKRYYRTLDVLLVDDIQFLQNRQNFEEEFCNTFESLINQNKQIVISSDKPPSQLKLSNRMIARMEWGLVAHIGAPELETRIAIIQQKAKQKNFNISDNVAFFIANNIYNNIRQLEGAINKLCAYCTIMHIEITKEIANNLLKEMFEQKNKKISKEEILKMVSSAFDVKISEIKGTSRKKNIKTARQVAMYLLKDLLDESLEKIADFFGGKKHSTLIHACKKIEEEIQKNAEVNKKLQMIKNNLN